MKSGVHGVSVLARIHLINSFQLLDSLTVLTYLVRVPGARALGSAGLACSALGKAAREAAGVGVTAGRGEGGPAA